MKNLKIAMFMALVVIISFLIGHPGYTFAAMFGISYLYRMPAGIPGAVNRIESATIEPEIPDPVNGPTAYGVFVKWGASGVVPAVAAGDVTWPTVLAGLAVRPFPVQETVAAGNEAFNVGTPDLSRPIDILKRGYMTVALAGTATPAKGNQVYLVTTAAAGYVAGTISASATNATAVPYCVFQGAQDSNGYVEIAFNL